ncbi:MAG TPA: BolA family protein [Arenimonas sp.]|nr:BolA family protein [Arenimonas sp.]HOZ06328.1 BolA family protein [Arenimonas sp.]HPW31985.1 BolA family protein [Arenimonas sp.]
MSDRVEKIRLAIEAALKPASLEIVDQSHRHAGHAGARDGRGHFDVRIVSDAFKGKLPLARHRLVFAAVGNLMETDIHALSIKALSTDEAS